VPATATAAAGANPMHEFSLSSLFLMCVCVSPFFCGAFWESFRKKDRETGKSKRRMKKETEERERKRKVGSKWHLKLALSQRREDFGNSLSAALVYRCGCCYHPQP